mmetsp:Transcript_1993/g.4391  ORF Transcript_1993/g.4391 Transcript_1993/m.4391 type:complete len:195 (-) Transcript_1993:629-1213(-)|eukprot:CAMPEP_0185853428 /NCGR_PEP_ID=MMETSP1354-20130828/18974_1 /TAXON_ID=708628 /ORGANISM="Erythrolobus madagascarensis, Strain CCMP3276" /LENGTH=194 /DNA_ID=CAMNT_0028554917 /DNA_START=182 /DNA_END=766 /DNA_ORIENTATION=+
MSGVQMFGLVIPGRPVVTEFAQIDATKVLAVVPNAHTIFEACLFLLPGTALPAGLMATLYASTPPHNDWIKIGSISSDTPSLMALVKWKTAPETGSIAHFGVSAEPMTPTLPVAPNSMFIGDAVAPASAAALSFSNEERTLFAKAIATDLLRYLTSFGHAAGEEGMRLLDQWFAKFSRKMDTDPNFWKKVLLKD